MREVERSAASVEDAIAAALEELGISEQQASVEVVQEPRSGFLGLASQPAIVRVRAVDVTAEEPAEGSEGPESEEAAEGAPPDVERQADLAADFLEELLERMSIAADVEIASAHGATYVEIWSRDEGADDTAVLIGRRGATLQALQELVRAVVQRETGERCRVLVDVEDYRKRRRARVVRQAREVAGRVRRSGREEALPPMTAYERKLVHDAVAEFEGLETVSEGEEPNRRVVIRRRPQRRVRT